MSWREAHHGCLRTRWARSPHHSRWASPFIPDGLINPLGLAFDAQIDTPLLPNEQVAQRAAPSRHTNHQASDGFRFLPLAAGITEQAVRQHLREGGAALDEARVPRRRNAEAEPVPLLPRKISPELENLLNRNFQAVAPNEKWLTDITEFQLPTGKVYLSPMTDCFVVSWSIGMRPDAELVNSMLGAAISRSQPTVTDLLCTLTVAPTIAVLAGHRASPMRS